MLCERNLLLHCYKLINAKYSTGVRNSLKARKIKIGKALSVAKKLNQYFASAPHLTEIRQYVPRKHQCRKVYGSVTNLYLVDSEIGKAIARRVFPLLGDTKNRVICETNPGLGLVTSELLELGLHRIRLYENCVDFRRTLKSFNEAYPNQVELFVKDLFHLGPLTYIDKQDGGNRVKQLLSNVPKKEWTDDDPAMTVIGTMASQAFLKYLMKMIALQSQIITLGRLCLFVIMRPEDYIKITALPESNLHIYRFIAIFFQNFFECEKIDEYNRQAFLPWENLVNVKKIFPNVNLDVMYLAKITMKKNLPLVGEEILGFYYFIKHFFARPTSKIIGTIEKWMPGIGVLILTSVGIFKDDREISIFTSFGELNPVELLSLFRVISSHPMYKSSPFSAMIDSHLMQSETIETDIAGCISNTATEDMKEDLSPATNK